MTLQGVESKAKFQLALLTTEMDNAIHVYL